jgi:peptide/nickel transport system permease protein
MSTVFVYALKRLLYAVPIALGVTLVSFMLVHMAPGDALNAIAPADAPVEVIEALKSAYGLDRPVPVQYGLWLARALQGDLGTSIASGRAVAGEVLGAVSNTLMLAGVASLAGVLAGCVLGALAGYLSGSAIDRFATVLSVIGVSIPHYWLGLVLTIIFSITLGWLPAMGAGADSSSAWVWDLAHMRYLVLPAATMSVIPMGIITRTVRALVSEMLNKEFVVALRARGLSEVAVFRHIAKNVAPTVLAVAGLQVGYLMGGSILVETVFAWPGTGFLLNTAIFQRDMPLLQGTILVLCMFFVVLNLVVDILQPLIDPRMART